MSRVVLVTFGERDCDSRVWEGALRSIFHCLFFSNINFFKLATQFFKFIPSGSAGPVAVRALSLLAASGWL